MTHDKPLVAVLDGDIIAYRAAFWAETEGLEYLEERLAHDLKAWTPLGVGKVYVATSCSRSENYRRKVWDAYKRNRDTNRKIPEHLALAEEIVSATNHIKVVGIEADDIMGMMASGYKAIAVTIDKDLRSVFGWHWNPDKEPEPVNVNSTVASHNFHKQWLMGDTTDNIPGIWKCGPKKAEKILAEVPESSWTTAVIREYQHATDSSGMPYSYDFCLQMARCVRILHTGEFCKTTKTPLLWEPPPQ